MCRLTNNLLSLRMNVPVEEEAMGVFFEEALPDDFAFFLNFSFSLSARNSVKSLEP